MNKRTKAAVTGSFVLVMLAFIAILGTDIALGALSTVPSSTTPLGAVVLAAIAGVCATLMVSVSKKYEDASLFGLVAALVIISVANGVYVWNASSFQASHSIIETGTVTNAYWWNQGSGSSYEMVENLTITLHNGNIATLYLTCNYYRIGSNITLQAFPSKQPSVIGAPSGCSVTSK